MASSKSPMQHSTWTASGALFGDWARNDGLTARTLVVSQDEEFFVLRLYCLVAARGSPHCAMFRKLSSGQMSLFRARPEASSLSIGWISLGEVWWVLMAPSLGIYYL